MALQNHYLIVAREPNIKPEAQMFLIFSLFLLYQDKRKKNLERQNTACAFSLSTFHFQLSTVIAARAFTFFCLDTKESNKEKVKSA